MAAHTVDGLTASVRAHERLRIAEIILNDLDLSPAQRLRICQLFVQPSDLPAKQTQTQPPRRFSAAARRRMSAGMRKFWARRKAAAKGAK